MWLRQRWWTQKPWTRAGYSTVETGRKEQTEKTTPWKKQRGRGLNAGVYKLRPAHRRHRTHAGEGSPATPQLCSWRGNVSESSWYTILNIRAFKILLKLTGNWFQKREGVGLGKEIQFKIKMRNSARLLWSLRVPPEMTSLSRSTLCKNTCSLFKCCEATGSHCSGSAGHHMHRSEHTARTNAPNPYSTALKEALLLSLLWERKQGSAKSNNLPQWSWDLKLCGLAPKSLC